MPLCKICEAIDINDSPRLGEYTEITNRAEAGCEACKFYCNILQNSERWIGCLDELPGNIVFLSSQRLDVRSPDKEDRGSFTVDDLLFDYVVAEDYTGEKDEDTDIRRIIPSDSKDEVCFDQLRSWLKLCIEHKSCPTSDDVVLPARIIEVSSDPAADLKLISSDGKMGKYVVLSQTSESTEEANLNLPQAGEFFAGSSLPKTFADAVTITRRLGYRYLWIPSLCTQHDPASTSNFPQIYGRSAVMISTSFSETLESGIFHERKVFTSPALGKNKDRYMRQKLLRWDRDLNPSSTTPRGWNALERILAPRIVHYTKRQIIFECANGLKFEGAGIPDKVTGSRQVRMTYRKEFVQPFITSYLQHNQSRTSLLEKKGDYIPARLEANYQTIHHLARQTFTTPQQKLLAISTIAQILSPNQELGPWLSGLFTSHLASSLSWSRVNDVLDPTSSYIAPSWSPLSVSGSTSSLFLDWKPAMFLDQKENPSLISKYSAKLLSHDLPPVDENKPYGPVKEGSNITVCGSVTGLMELLKEVQEDKHNTFHPTFVLDKSWALDCSVCAHHSSTYSPELIEQETEKASKEMEHHIVLFLEGGFWGLGLFEGVVDCVVLTKREGGEEEGYERVGFLRLNLEYRQGPAWEREDGAFDRGFVEEKFGSLGWERRELKLF